MCRVEERVYVGSDGRRQIFEDKFPCDKSHKGKLCSKVKRRTTEYFPKQPPPIISRDNTSSPLSSALSSNNPPTPPAGTGNYVVETRRPSVAGARPSTRDSKIVIEFSGGKKDGKSKKYPLVTVNKSYKRSSFGATSVTSNEGAVESPGSEASYTVRTGFADVPVPPTDSLSQAQGYRTRHDVPQSHHRHVSSSSSQTTSSQPPSLYATSEPESPANSSRQLPVYPRTIVHNPPSGAPPSPSATRAAAPASPSYRTKTVSPQKLSRENVGADGLTPLDYSDFIEPSASSHASSGRAVAPEITDRALDRERRRKHKDEEKKRQEEADRRYAEDLAAKEEVKQVRFELGRAEDRAKQRGEQKLAESEKRRAEEREDARRRKKEAEEKEDARRRKKDAEEREDARRRKKDAEERPPTKKPEREKTKPPTRDHTRRHVRRASMTQADIDERNRLRLQEEAQMAREREATEIREREERAAALRQSQQTSDYWDPRAAERYPVQNNSTGMGRRGSVSGRRPSVSGNPPPVGGLGRSNSTRRVSIIQPVPPANLPPLTSQFPQQQQQQQQPQQQTNYSTRATNSQYQNPAPLFSSNSYNSASRPPSARHHSQHDNPFAQPPTRTSHSSQDSNPFTLPSTRPMHPSHPPVLDNPFAAPAPVLHSPPVDPWDNRDMRDALPRQTLQRRGEEVISRAEGMARRPQQSAATAHGRAQQATRNLGTAQGFADAYESSSEEDEMKLAGKGARMGFGKSRRY